jgi:molybdate transport system substrate-binding protein
MPVHERRFMGRIAGVAGACALIAVAAVPPVQADNGSRGLLVFAAASLKTALDELLPALTQAAGKPVRASYAASSALARQIEAGAPADIFISADEDWMNYVAERHLIDQRSRVLLLGNRLVLIAPAGQQPTLRIAPGFPLAAALGDGRLAVADPAAVPAGKYARAALTALGVWAQVERRLAPAENVRAALRLVSTEEAPLGIVYGSDAVADKGVVVVDSFPASSHPPIHYPAAVLATAKGDAPRRALAALQTPSARAVFERNGFRWPGK